MNERAGPLPSRRVIDPERFLARVRERRDRMTMSSLSPDELRASNDEDLERRGRVAQGQPIPSDVGNS